MNTRNKLRFMHTLVYKLKRDYGESIDVYRQIGETIDLTTGRKIVVKMKLNIRRAILLPSRVAENFANQIAYGGGMNNAKYQGLFDSSQRLLVIDKSDLKGEFKQLTTSDWVIFNHTRWEISELEEFEQEVAYWLILKQIKGAPVYEVHTPLLKDKLRFSEEVAL